MPKSFPCGNWHVVSRARMPPSPARTGAAHNSWHLQNSGDSVRAIRQRVTFPAERSVKFPNASGIEYGLVDFRFIVVEAQRERLKTPLHNPVIFRRQVDFI